MSSAAPETLSNAEIAREIQALQARAFERYEDAALQAEAVVVQPPARPAVAAQAHPAAQQHQPQPGRQCAQARGVATDPHAQRNQRSGEH